MGLFGYGVGRGRKVGEEKFGATHTGAWEVYRETRKEVYHQDKITIIIKAPQANLVAETINFAINAPQPPRNIRKTLSDSYLPELQHLTITDLNHDTYTRKLIMQQIHHNSVLKVLKNYTPNLVLCTISPPEIDELEKSLHRRKRVILVQLRSGWCQLLQNYKSRIDPAKMQERCTRSVSSV